MLVLLWWWRWWWRGRLLLVLLWHRTLKQSLFGVGIVASKLPRCLVNTAAAATALWCGHNARTCVEVGCQLCRAIGWHSAQGSSRRLKEA